MTPVRRERGHAGVPSAERAHITGKAYVLGLVSKVEDWKGE